jgi:tetratricopeptide (TPR) repeat protein
MKRGFSFVLVLGGFLAGIPCAMPQLRAQAPAKGDAAQKPAAGAPTSANPFPEDTTNVPVLPAASGPAVPVSKDEESAPASGKVLFSSDDLDPVRSPDDPEPEAVSDQPGDSSSSLNGLEGILPREDEDRPTGKKKNKAKVEEPVHEETAKEDVSVGGYYLEKKNWKAAQSRFQSAMVLDPEDPEVYWGLAESAYHLGDFASARGWYTKLLDYDPDGPHGKQARKALKDPALANAVSVAPAVSSAK